MGPRMKPADLVLPDQEAGANMSQARTCAEAWLDPRQGERDGDGGLLEEVALRTASLTRVTRGLQEDFRVLEYRRGQHFVAHTDYYEAEDFKNQAHIERELRDGRNWLVTVFLYLRTPRAGGETYFPSTYGKPLPAELGKCDGPSVKPVQGRALVFYSLHPDSTPNLSSMHGSCKIRKGSKYTVNIWPWNQRLEDEQGGV